MKGKKITFCIRTLTIALLMAVAAGKAAAHTTEAIDRYADVRGDSLVKTLNDTIRSRDKTINQLRKDLEKRQKEWEKKLKRVSDSLEKAFSDTVRSRDKTIKQLRKDLDKANQKLLNSPDSLVRELREAEEALERAETEKTEADEKIRQLDEELAMLRPFREAMLRQMLETAKEWEKQPFSQVDTAAVAKLLSDCDRYGNNDKEIMREAKTLRTMQEDMKKYFEAEALLHQPFNEQAKNDARKQLRSLRENYKDKPQLQEMDVTYSQLDDYKGSILLFQQLINSMNEALEEYRNAKNKTLAKNVIKKKLEEFPEEIEAIETIPYLKSRIDKYQKALEEKPLEHWSGEQEILDMLK